MLLLLGWALLTLLEWDNTLAGLPVIDRLINGLFMSVTARTAGFNSIDYNQAADSSNFVTMLLMMIGGSPGSTAGGLKTTTVALIFLMALSRSAVVKPPQSGIEPSRKPPRRGPSVCSPSPWLSQFLVSCC